MPVSRSLRAASRYNPHNRTSRTDELSRSARESIGAQSEPGLYARGTESGGRNRGSLVALVLWQAPPCRPLWSASEHTCPIAGRTILPKVSFDIPRGTTLETFASRSVRKGKIAIDGLADASDKVIGNGWNSFCRLALMRSVVTPVTAG
jgi:hypothetical protein